VWPHTDRVRPDHGVAISMATVLYSNVTRRHARIRYQLINRTPPPGSY
jgi:hypothetical protein